MRWSEQLSTNPVRPGKSPLALRVRLDDGSGFDLTEAGTRKRLAVHVVEDPSDVPQIATLGVEPLSDEFTEDRLAELLAARNQQIKGLLRDQGTIAGIGNAYSDEILLAAADEPVRHDEVVRRRPHAGAVGGDPRGAHAGPSESGVGQARRPSSRTRSAAA